MKNLQRFISDESGATAIEYALIAALMAAAIITALGTFSTDMASAFGKIGTTLTTKTK
ncbi:MAG: Flp family type IVb pilin [Rhizobiales bacterium PAR1]|nr:MAG: Flp family type IVb pilin [Rhizobiales bacterium PAR1]